MIQVRVEGLYKGQVIEYEDNELDHTRVLKHSLSASSDGSSASSCGSPKSSNTDSHTSYVIHLSQLAQNWSVAFRFSTIRRFRNDLLKLKSNRTNQICPLQSSEIKNVLEYGFPERKLFGSNRLNIIADRAYKIQNCLEAVLTAHTDCSATDCPSAFLLRDFLKLPEQAKPKEIKRLNVVPHKVQSSSNTTSRAIDSKCSQRRLHTGGREEIPDSDDICQRMWMYQLK